MSSARATSADVQSHDGQRAGIVAGVGTMIASGSDMRTVTRLFWIGVGIAIGATLWRRGGAPTGRRRGSNTIAPEEDIALAEEVDADELVIPPGLSQVDPGPISHVTEALDPEATAAAHQGIGEQRERLPVPGKNLP